MGDPASQKSLQLTLPITTTETERCADFRQRCRDINAAPRR
jgi:hypothetical protein